MSRILIADDDANLRYSFRTWMRREGYEIDEASDGRQAVEMALSENYDAVVMDIRMPGLTGLQAIEKIHAARPHLPVIIITAFGTTDTAIETMRLGAYDYVLKPMEPSELKRIIASAIEDSRLTSTAVRLPDSPTDGSGDPRIVGSSPAMQEVYKLIGKVSRTDSTVLITGPSGSGKELVARAIYTYGNRNEKPFQAVNCAAVPETLLESELFGHEKGAFTGAMKTKIGRFERVDGGTLFLDEIGDMPLTMQAKILRVLQEQKFERVGGTSSIQVDVRVIAATNKDLATLAKEGQFREDLYYRLQVVHIRMPSLSERRGDIAELVDYFIHRFNTGREQNIEGISQDALQMLKEKDWPGNVRELQNAVQRAMVLCPVSILRIEDFEFLSSTGDRGSAAADLSALAHRLVQDYLDEDTTESDLLQKMEAHLMEAVLQHTDGNQVQAAKLLGVSRNTLASKMKKYGLG